MSLIHEARVQARTDANNKGASRTEQDSKLGKPYARPSRWRPALETVRLYGWGVVFLCFSAVTIAIFIGILHHPDKAPAKAPPQPVTAVTPVTANDLSPHEVAAEVLEPAVEEVQTESVKQVEPKVEPTVIAPHKPQPLLPLADIEGKILVKSVRHQALDQTIELEGIVWSTDSTIAMINGSLVRPGDELGALRILTIGRKRVQLQAQGITFYLIMP